MSDQTRPNLFHYATSELSQDAFICWLAAWADPKFKDDPALHQAGANFISSMIRKVKSDYDVTTLKAVKVSRQVGKLDILIEINKPDHNGEAPGELAILVEDKTHTFDHGTQLTDYYNHVVAMGYNERQMVPLYFKTGYQSRFDTLVHFNTYLREDFLTVLIKGRESVKNAIYQDFLAHLENMENVVNQYEKKDPNGWDENDWRGFFMNLYKNRSQFYDVTESDGANWNYVPNPSGGFFGFWWYFKEVTQYQYVPYLQLEQDKLCFKIMVKGESDRRGARNQAFEKIQESASQLGMILQRPERMGNGKFMTVLRWQGDYRESKDRKLDMTSTLENLKKAQMLLDAAFST